MDDPAFSSELERRCAAPIRKIPVERIHIFCASCAERFFDGYAAWSAEETSLDERKALPPAEFVRGAIDVCWEGRIPAKADDLLRTLVRMMPGANEQPIFKLPLNDYFLEAWLLQLGLSCVLDPQVSFGLSASAAALDFHWQLLIRRREMTGIGPAFDDPEWDREFEIDPRAVAESAIQIEDAEELSLGVPDLKAVRRRSADRGARVLEEVRRLLAL